MNITALDPISEVRLLNGVPLDNRYENTLSFGSKLEQIAYFTSKVKAGATFTNLTPVDLNNAIQLPINAYTIYDCNYLMFKNENFNSKWLYAFITDIKYISVNCCALTFEIDVMQTWYFDYTLKHSFVQREHVDSDQLGEHLTDEGLDLGEYTVKSRIHISDLTEIWYVVGYSDGVAGTYGGVYGNVYSGLRFRAFSHEGASVTHEPSNTTDLTDFLSAFSTAGKSDAIAIIFTIPKMFLPDDIVNGLDITYNFTYNVKNWNFVCDRNTLINYTPKNKKLLSYPFNFIYASNNKGGSATYRIENFTLDGNTITFAISGNLAPNPTGVLIPLNYKNVGNNREEQLTIDGFPLCSWNNDVYANWLAANSPSVWANSLTSAGFAVAGAASANIPMAVSGLTGVLSSITSTYAQSMQPDQARGNVNCGSLNCAMGVNTFYISQMCIKKEYAERIDKFFDMYGYKVNTVKIPNVTGRPYWNYVKTIGCNATGSIPFNDMSKIKSIYDNGVTFWHGDYVGNYNLDNSI